LLFEIDAEVLHDDPGLIRTSLIFTKSFLTDWSIGQENLTSQREFSGFSGKNWNAGWNTVEVYLVLEWILNSQFLPIQLNFIPAC
jgi:hypothetical protein